MLIDCEGADRFVQLMQRLSGDWVSDLTGRTMLLTVIFETIFHSLITNTQFSYYSLIKVLPLLDKWLQDLLNGKFDDTESHKSVFSFLRASSGALYHQHVSLSDLRTCNIVETVLRLQRKSVVDTMYTLVDLPLESWAAENKCREDELLAYVRGRSIQ